MNEFVFYSMFNLPFLPYSMRIIIFKVVYKLKKFFLFSLTIYMPFFRVCFTSFKDVDQLQETHFGEYWESKPQWELLENEAIANLAWPREMLVFNSCPCNELCFGPCGTFIITTLISLVFWWLYSKFRMIYWVELPFSYITSNHYC